MAFLAENKYGKSRVRLMKVRRLDDRHEVKEWNVQVLLEGDFETCFTVGDNSKILPTDTMKNTVYSLARSSTATCMESFAKELITHFLERNPQLSSVSVEMEEKSWPHVVTNEKMHPTTFKQSGPEVFTTFVQQKRGGSISIQSGVKGLVILKTSKSGFAGYIKDSLTTLKETHDRLFGTEATITWTYDRADLPFSTLRADIMRTLLCTFAKHESLSVQHTLFAMGKAVLDAAGAVMELELVMPNRHCLLVDLTPFGQDNPNMIFVPTDEPHGYIEAKVTREAR
ncbi:MAG: factor-independent urate hydroxylase [Acidobacteriaceae bacterium]